MHENLSKDVKLVCPRCRKMTQDGLAVSNIELGDIIQKNGEYILYGFLKCENPECNTKYPIIEGVPCIMIPAEQDWWSELVSMLDTMEPPSEIRNYIKNIRTDKKNSSDSQTKGTILPGYEQECLMGCFMDNNYGEFAPNYKPSYPWADYRPYWQTVIDTSRPTTETEYNMALEMGCSVGRYTFEMARMSKLVVGLDIRFRSVFEAARFQRREGVTYNKRVRGLLFEEVQTDFEPLDNILFLAGNALDPPFLSESFDFVAGLNLLDNIKQPSVLLGQMNALLRPGGVLLIGSPYEWRVDICEPTEWLETEMMDPVETVRRILEGKVLPEYGLDFKVESEVEVIWPLQNHDRYWCIFRANLMKARKQMN